MNKEIWDEVYSLDKDTLPWMSELWLNLSINVLDSIFGEKKNLSVFDYGGGSGHIGAYYANKGHEITVADISDKAVDRELFQNLNMKFVQADEPSAVSDMFDIIISWGVFHHIDYNTQISFLKQFKNMLKQNGTIAIGGWDNTDPEFIDDPNRISKVSKKHQTYTVNHLLDNDIFNKVGLNLLKTDTYEFKEPKYNDKPRIFRFYVLS